MSEYLGIDVAKWQGAIDWSKVKAAGIKFAILKVTNKSNNKEEAFETNYAGATNNCIPVGVYRYVYAKTTAEAKKEANAIVAALDNKKITCGVWLDMEDESIRGIGKGALTSVINTEVAIIRAAGYKVGIYCSLDWYKNVLDSKNLATLYPFWIARYPKNDTGVIKSSLSPASYNNVVAWQYSSKGKVDGIYGNVDLDVAFKDLTIEMTGRVDKRPNPYKRPTHLVCTKATAKAKKYSLTKYVASGEEVKWVQFELVEAECFGADGVPLSIDGKFGPNSEYALVKYQEANGLTVDGVCGPKTVESLETN